MIALLALRNLVLRPWRSAFLLFGYSLGVAVMIVLLSIGEALLAQARDEKLVGGGDVTVLPEGIDVEVLKTGGLGGMFFSIDHARFIYRQLLAAPRLAPFVDAVAPQIEGKLLYARTRDGREIAGAGERRDPVAHGGGRRDAADRGRRRGSTTATTARGAIRSRTSCATSIDHFHLPPGASRARSDVGGVALLQRAVGRPSDVGVHLVHRRRRGAERSLGRPGARDAARAGRTVAPLRRDRSAERGALLDDIAPISRLAASSVAVLADGRYAVRAHATEERGADVVDVNLVVTPAPRRVLPRCGAVERRDGVGLRRARRCARTRPDRSASTDAASSIDERASVSRPQLGRVARRDAGSGARRERARTRCSTDACSRPTARSRRSRCSSTSSTRSASSAVFRPREIRYDDARVVRVGGRDVHVPSRGDDGRRARRRHAAHRADDRGRDGDGHAHVRASSAAKDSSARQLARPYFVQMKGWMRISGRVGGKPITGEGAGFFETYR